MERRSAWVGRCEHCGGELVTMSVNAYAPVTPPAGPAPADAPAARATVVTLVCDLCGEQHLRAPTSGAGVPPDGGPSAHAEGRPA